MTESNYQNRIDSNQQYSPIINDCDFPSNNAIQDPQIIQTNNTPEENNLNQNPGENIIYKTPFGCCQIFSFCCFIIVIIFGFIFALVAISNIANDSVFISFIFPIFAIIIGCCCNSSYYIIYDSIQKRIILRQEKIFNCIKTNQIIQINDIQRVVFKKYNGGDAGRCFKVKIILSNGFSYTAIDIPDNKGQEYTKAFQSLKNILPEEIYFEELNK